MPSFTFYASAEAIPPTGAAPVFCDIDLGTLQPRRRDRPRRPDAADQGGRRRRPLRQPGADQEIGALGVPVSRTPPRPPAPPSTAARPARSATPATFSFFPSKNLGCFGDGGRGRTATPTWPRRADAPLPRLSGQAALRGRRAQLPPGRAAGGDPARGAARAAGWAGGRRGPRRAPTRGRGRRTRDAGGATPGAQPAWHLYLVRHPRGRALAGALSARRAGARYYRDARCTSSPPSRPPAAGPDSRHRAAARAPRPAHEPRPRRPSRPPRSCGRAAALAG